MALCITTRLTNVAAAHGRTQIRTHLNRGQLCYLSVKISPSSATYGLDLTEDAAANSPFLRILPAEVLAALPPSMLAFHVTGGHCAGPLLVERGSGLAAIVAALGQLPPNTPPEKRNNLDNTVVTSEYCEASGGVNWKRIFPGARADLESRWYFDETSQLAVDSFTWMGIKDFAAFGFTLEPCSASSEEGSGGASQVGFLHVTKAVWVLGMRLPSFLAMTADGASIAHSDGDGWDVDVNVIHPFIGPIVSYKGYVRTSDTPKPITQ